MKKIKSIASIILVLVLLLVGCGKKPANQKESTAPTTEPIAVPKVTVTSFEAGAVFREFHWNGPFVNASTWQRVTDPNVKNEEAHKFLPNPINTINLSGLDEAVKVEMVIELWGGHAGTRDKLLRVNDNEWISVPESEFVGETESPERYMQFRYPAVTIPLAQLKDGDNTFEFSCGEQTVTWGQWGVYGITFRLYYPVEMRPQNAQVVLGASENESLTFSLDSAQDDIAAVEYVGFYEDFDINGDGIYNEWHYTYRYGEMQSHIGTSVTAPYSVTWDTTWVPDQEQPMKIMAVVESADGLQYITPVLEDINLNRSAVSVKMYKPYNVPENWMTRDKKTHFCNIMVDDDLSKAIDSKLIMTTWHGKGCTDIKLNTHNIASNVGLDHNYSYDELLVTPSQFVDGRNFLVTYSTTLDHGIEVLWPGIVAKIRYNK